MSSIMASKEGGQAFAPVLAAVATMQGNVSRSEKTQAHEFLEKFQKSVCPHCNYVRFFLTRPRSRHGRPPMRYYSHPMYPWRLNCSRRLH